MRAAFNFSRIKNIYEHTKPFCPKCFQNSSLIKYKGFTNSLSLIHTITDSSSGNTQCSEEIPEPKKTLWRLINEVFAIQQNPDIKPTVTIQQIEPGKINETKWQVTISMAWPEKFQVEAVATKKNDAEKNSFLLACQKMKGYGILDKNNNPVLPKTMLPVNDNNLDNSKAVLCNIYERIWTRFGKKEYIPKFNTVQIPGFVGNEKYWKSELQLIYPEYKSFESYGARLRDAEKIVSAKALVWLKDLGVINKKKRLIQFTKEDDFKLLELQSAPYSIHIPKILQEKTEALLHTFREHESITPDISDRKSSRCVNQVSEVYDVITEKLYRELSKNEIISRSQNIFAKKCLLDKTKDPEIQEIRAFQSQLPISHKREDILRIIEDNQVLVLSGETGCGKTTQVPQFILDHYISNMEGALCNIVITQPRRISAISMALRVSAERGEKVGETVGYQVRLNKKLPSQKGAILYCSTGMLLRKLCSNPTLEGVSHVIVDEVHERNIQIDFLLILLKRLIENNKKLKLIIMSASFNTCIFSNYFENCPVIHIPGRNYPVKDYYLDEILTNIQDIKSLGRKDPFLDSDLVVNVINHIDKYQKPGAILCFLPGWNDILTVKSKLSTLHSDPSKLMICCAHSRLPIEEQKNIFKKPPAKMRKVILATNIAETSITVNDVVYVVDSGLYKGTSFDCELGVAALSTQWITKSNVKQRSGRAGRVQPGICFHLFTRKVLMEMEDYPLPELLRTPLESVILDCKRYCPETKAEDFLSAALQAPSRLSLQAGVEELQIIGVLDETEHLTDLGEIIVNFGTHPRLSVALVYAAFLRCLDPVLTICATLTLGKEPFLNTLEDKSLIKNIKKAHDNYLFSDHLSLNRVFEEWKKINSESDPSLYAELNFLDEQSLIMISDLKYLFAENLSSASIIKAKEDFSDPQNDCNKNSHHIPCIFAALSAAFYPNIIKVLQGEVSERRLNKDAQVYSLLKGHRGYIQKGSVASNESELPSPWLVYFSALQSKARRLMMTPAVSCVPGIGLLLFSGKQLSLDKESSHTKEAKQFVTIILDDHKKLNFSCTREEAELIMEFRNRLNAFFTSYIHSLNTKSDKCDEAMALYDNEFLPILKNILETPQVPYTKGQSYKFVDDCLVSEEL